MILYGDEDDRSHGLFNGNNQREERKLQNDHNIKNNIEPKTILKSVDEIMFSTAVADSKKEIYKNEELPTDKVGLSLEDKIEVYNKFTKARLWLFQPRN